MPVPDTFIIAPDFTVCEYCGKSYADTAENMHRVLIEKDGAWIRKEYRQTAITLGIAKPSDFRKPRENHNKQINDFMAERLKIALCKKCGGKLKQTRSGSLRGKCDKCNVIYVLGKRKNK